MSLIMEANENKDIKILEKSIRRKDVQDGNTDSGKSAVAFSCACSL
jgi:hypothetical protein